MSIIPFNVSRGVTSRLRSYYDGNLCKCGGNDCRLATGVRWTAVSNKAKENRGMLIATLCKEDSQ